MISKIASKLTTGGLLLLAAAGGAAAQTDAWDVGHPDAKLLMGIDLKSLRESAVGQAVRSQMSATAAQQMGPAAMALGFLEQVDHIFISSPALTPARATLAKKPGAPSPSPAISKVNPPVNPPFLLMVDGTLPLQMLLAFLPGTPHRYHMVDIYRGAKATDASIAMLDTRTIVIGDEKSVTAAIDRHGHGMPPASPILARAQELAATHDFWMIASDDLSKFQPANTGFSSPMAGQIKGVEMGVAVRDGFQFEMSLATESSAMAEQLTQLISMQLTAAQAKNPETAEVMRKLQVGTEGNQLRMSLSLTKEELEQNLRTMQATRMAAAVPPQSTGQTQAAPPKPKTPGKIRIYGLDEGVREIPLTK